MAVGKNELLLIAKMKNEMSQELNKAEGDMKNMHKTAIALTTVVVALGAAAFATAVKMGKYGASIYDAHTFSKVLMEDLQGLNYVFEQSGGGAGDFERALRGVSNFMRTASTEGSEQARMLERLGLSYQELEGLGLDQTFYKLTDALNGLETRQEQLIVGSVVFGSRYTETVLRALDQTGGSIEGAVNDFKDLGMALSEEQVTSLKEFDDAMTTFGYDIKKLTADAIVPLLPLFHEVLEIAADMGKEVMPTLVPLVRLAAGAFKIVADNFTILKPLMVGLTVAIYANQTAITGWTVSLTTATTKAISFKAAAAGLKNMLGPAMLGAAVVWTAGKVVELNNVINETEEALDHAANEAGPMADAAVRIDTIMAGLARTLKESDMPALLSLREEMEEISENTSFNMAHQIGQVNERLNTMGVEGVEAAIATRKLALAMAESTPGLDVYSGVILQQIERLQALKAEISGMETTEGEEEEEEELSYGPSPESEDERAEEVKETWEDTEAKILESSLANLQALDHAKKISMVNRIRMEEEEAEAMLEATTAQVQQVLGQFEQFGTGFVNAMVEGEDAIDRWAQNFADQLKKLVVSAAFKTVLNFLTGGMAGSIGGLIGFQSGTPQTGVLKAASGVTVRGQYGDRIPALLSEGEVVTTKAQRLYEQNYSHTESREAHVIFNYQPLVSTASLGEIAAAKDEIGRLIDG